MNAPPIPLGSDVVLRGRRRRQSGPLQEEKLRQDGQEEERRGRRQPRKRRGARDATRPSRAPGGVHQGGPQQLALLPGNIHQEGAALAERGQPQPPPVSTNREHRGANAEGQQWWVKVCGSSDWGVVTFIPLIPLRHSRPHREVLLDQDTVRVHRNGKTQVI